MKTLFQSTRLVNRAYWLVRLRWLAIAFLCAATFTASRWVGVSLPSFALYVTAGVLVVYNFLLLDLLNYLTWRGKSPSQITITNIIIFQVAADLLILTVILHYSGGIENPFFFFFVFHMTIASILLERVQSYLQATFATCLFAILIFLEYKGVIAHYPLVGFAAEGLYLNKTFVVGTFVIFSITLYLVVYMTSSVSDLLTKQYESYERANKQLEEKDYYNNEYVLRLTHDIRGHIAAIQSCLNIVTEQMVGPLNEKQQDMVERACRRASKCMAFITALLKLTRMKQSGKLEMSDFSLRNAVFNALAAAENKASKKTIRISHNIDEAVDEIYGEPFLIEEAISNILLNAVKYSYENGEVELKVEDKGDCVLVEISDNGIGIPENELEKIFEEFYRAENARKVERDGTGLGLSIAKQVVKRHGGKIWAEKREPGGSRFCFTLPKIKKTV